MNKWKEKLFHILSWKPDLRLTAAVFAIALALLLIPLIRLSFYAVPWYDDYNYGRSVKNFLELDYSLKSAVEGAVYCARTNWYAWQGTFSSIFFMSLVPMVWGEEYYFAGPVFLVLLLPVSVWLLGKVLLGDLLKADRAVRIVIQSVAAAVCVLLVYSARSGFFWYNAGIHYVGMHSFLLLLAAAWLRLLAGAGKTVSALLVFWTVAGAVLVAGANYVTALQGGLVGLSLAALAGFLRNKKVWLLMPSLAVYGYAFYKNVSAPGNNVRKAILQDAGLGMDAVPSIIRSFGEGFRHIGEFTGLITVAFMLLLAPFIWRMVRRAAFGFRWPGVLLLWSVCLYAAGFAPSLYTTGTAGPDRTLNAVKLTYQILLFVNEVYWLGWLGRKLESTKELSLFGWKWDKKEETGKEEQRPSALFFLAAGIGLLGIFAAEPDKAEKYSSFGAYECVRTGEANNFYQEYLTRLALLESPEKDLVFEPCGWTPELLFSEDLSKDPWAGQNTAIAEWYGKESVRVLLDQAGRR